MTYNVMVAEPTDRTWATIADGVRRQRSDAEILRVKDGEQAMRFLFRRGLLTEEPATPDLIVLALELPLVPVNAIIARIRQHPRTQDIPVILVWPQGGGEDFDAVDSQQWLHREPGVVVITGTHGLEKEVAHALDDFSMSRPVVIDHVLTATR